MNAIAALKKTTEIQSMFLSLDWWVGGFGGIFLLLIDVIDIKLLFQRKEQANVLCIKHRHESSVCIYICFYFYFFDIRFCSAFRPEKLTL